MSGYFSPLKIDDPDEFYARLIALHDGLSDRESAILNCKLIFILANQVGDRRALSDALGILERKP